MYIARRACTPLLAIRCIVSVLAMGIGHGQKTSTCEYNITEWTNTLFLEFGDERFVQEISKWQKKRGLSVFRPHVTLTTVDPETFPPGAADTPARIQDEVRAVLGEMGLCCGMEVEPVTMYLDGLTMFGDYLPYKMRNLQLEATGNFLGENFTDNRAVDRGLDPYNCPLYVPHGETTESYVSKTMSAAEVQSYVRLQNLREQLCRRFVSPSAKSECTAAIAGWKPHISVAYANIGLSQCIDVESAIAWTEEMSSQGILPTVLLGSRISYWNMAGERASQWTELSGVSLARRPIIS